MPAQQLTITLSNNTIQALQELGYALYALRGFNTTSAGSKPLVWRAMTDFANNVVVDFGITYAAYMSTASGSGGTIIVQMASVPVQLGQTATLADGGVLAVTTEGRADAVTLVNGTTTAFTTGLADRASGSEPMPIFAAPLYGLGESIVAPLDQFLVTFSTQGLTPGTPMDHSMSQSLLIDMSQHVSATASYDINSGWTPDGKSSVQLVKAGAPLAPLLARQTPML